MSKILPEMNVLVNNCNKTIESWKSYEETPENKAVYTSTKMEVKQEAEAIEEKSEKSSESD
jgi:hypothetical protein